jgi:hypothetical protein
VTHSESTGEVRASVSSGVARNREQCKGHPLRSEKALFLAERVIVFSDRPASVKSEVVVDRPDPRHRDDPCLAELRRRILEDLGLAETW